VRHAPSNTYDPWIHDRIDTPLLVILVAIAEASALNFPLAQWAASELFFVARGSVGTGEMVTSLRQAIAEVAPDLQVLQVRTLEDRVGVNLYPVRLAAVYLGTFGLMALILAVSASTVW